jgi:hypothetical protein
MAAFALALLPAAADGAAAGGCAGHAAAGAVHHSTSVHPSHSRKAVHSHVRTSSSTSHHVANHTTTKGARTFASANARYSHTGTHSNSTTGNQAYAASDVAERHRVAQAYEWHHRHHHGWHGHAWWLRHHWWTTTVASVTGSTTDISSTIIDTTVEGTTPGTTGQTIPHGSVKIINRKTGAALWDGERFRIEQSGDHYKIVANKSGNYLTLRPSTKHADGKTATHGARVLLSDSHKPESSAVLWNVEPVGDDCWRLVNYGNGKLLEDLGNDGVVVQSEPRDGALEQHWRVEPAAD